MGNGNVNIDVNKDTVDAINAGESSIYEPNLDDFLETHGVNELTATTGHHAILDTDITFLALSSPTTEESTRLFVPDGFLYPHGYSDNE